MSIIRGVVFDLDDTLYLEQDYVKSGFRFLSLEIEKKAKISSDLIFNDLWSWFLAGTRGNTFDLLAERYPGILKYVTVTDLVSFYRSHEPQINFIPGVLELLETLRTRGFKLGILSDGALESQRAKAIALRLECYFDLLVFTDLWGQSHWKPHQKGYTYIANEWGVAPQELVYVGDNPEKDFLSPKELGWRTVRLRQEGQLRYEQVATSLDHEADSAITEIRELIRVL